MCDREKRDPGILCGFKDFALNVDTNGAGALVQESVFGPGGNGQRSVNTQHRATGRGVNHGQLHKHEKNNNKINK